ncbi:MAG: tetratricopeptide repeat protein [Bacteroidales bacterium]
MKTLFKTTVFIAFSLLITNFIIAQDLKDAIYKTKAQQYEEAAGILKNLTEKTPGNGEIYFYLGEVYIKSFLADTFSMSIKEISEIAFPIFNEGVRQDSTSSFPYIGLGHLSMLRSEYTMADNYFDRARHFLPEYNLKKIKKIKDPNYISTVLVKIAESQNMPWITDTSKILPLLRDAELIDPNNAEIYLVAGDVYLAVHNGNKAIENYNKAERLIPTSPAANIKKGNIYLMAKNLGAALPYYEQALKIDSTYAPVYRELGKLYNLAGKYNVAKKYFAKYMELSGNNIPAKIRYISTLYFSKDYDEAVKQIEEVLKVDSSYLYLYRLAAYSLYDKKEPDYPKASFYIQKLFNAVKPENLITKDYIYHGHINLNLHTNYVKLCSDTARLNMEYHNYSDKLKSEKKPAEKSILQSKIDFIGQQLIQTRYQIREDSLELAKGFEYLITAFYRDSTNAGMASHIASLYNSFRQFESAAWWFQKKIQLNNQARVEDYFSLGNAYYNCKKYDDAINSFTKVTELDPAYIQGYYMLANTYSAKDPDSKLGLAKPIYETLIEKALVDTIKNVKELNVAYSFLGSYYLLVQPDYDLASSYFNKLIWLEPLNNSNLLRCYTSLAYLNTLKKDYQKVKYYYAEILKIDPGNQDAKNNLDYYNKLK